MSDHQSVPQTQDGSTEQSFVDSDYSFNVPGADFGGFSSPLMTSHESVDQWLYVSSWSQDAASLGSMDQENGFGATAGSAPQSHDSFSEAIFSSPMTGMDSHLSNIDSTPFVFSSSPVPFLDLPTAPGDAYKMSSLSGSPNTAAAL
ncbi:hypothetical protein HYE67_004288 [Fusarium culmorum]|uniref:Uncharacterized protein n=1 Tax=Fusarium culmorum TaxID=5516 RepID=A0A2T4GMG9_FUSCU|nr:hypothetical protein FCULG_00001558 [Fusarium culmorum]QPC62057.1 hypothetical protein HYE67_004288 [Fusarium culmorum]